MAVLSSLQTPTISSLLASYCCLTVSGTAEDDDDEEGPVPPKIDGGEDGEDEDSEFSFEVSPRSMSGKNEEESKALDSSGESACVLAHAYRPNPLGESKSTTTSTTATTSASAFQHRVSDLAERSELRSTR